MKIDFRIDILRNRVRIGMARCTAASINFRKEAEVCRGLKLTMSEIRMSKGIKFEMFSDRIRPVLIVNDAEEFFGVFMVISSPEKISRTGSVYELEAYDETMMLKQAAFTERTLYAAGTKYLTIINSLLTDCGFSEVIETDCAAVLPADIEIAPGETFLDTINSLLDGINYQHVHADSQGRIQIQPIADKQTADHVYSGHIIPPIERTTDIYDLPNVLIGKASTPDRTPLRYVKENNNPSSAISILKRGYKVTKTYEANNIADQATLEAYIDQQFYKASQITETVKVTTELEGDHEFGDTVQLKTDLLSGLFEEVEWSLSLGANGTMTHKLERKVFV